jgi:hypothetical protein
VNEAPFHRRPVLYPNHYVWFVLFSALDIMLTHRILGAEKFSGVMDEVFGPAGPFNGREMNSLADWIIHRFGLWGAIGFKFASVIFVVLVCEYVGRRVPKSGRRLANVVVALSIVPVAWELALLAWYARTGGGPG